MDMLRDKFSKFQDQTNDGFNSLKVEYKLALSEDIQSIPISEMGEEPTSGLRLADKLKTVFVEF